MSVEGAEDFPKTARLRKRPEFLRVSRTGRKIHTANFLVISKANDKGKARLGITVSAKVGNSVVRNRVKRLVREFFRRRRHEWISGVDIVVIARKSATGLSLQLVENELGKSLLSQRGRQKS
jgi:ribonuclease P protein component